MTCYYCISNVKDEKCELDIEGYPLPSDIECRHFDFDTGEERGKMKIGNCGYEYDPFECQKNALLRRM